MFSGNILQKITYFSRAEVHSNENYLGNVPLQLGDNYLAIADNKLANNKSKLCQVHKNIRVYLANVNTNTLTINFFTKIFT